MFLLHGDAKYLDVLEQVLYNGYLSGVSLSGDRFFYQNPLESAGRTDRSAYFDVACCPANLARLMEQVPGLLYSTRGNDLFLNLYAANAATREDPGRGHADCARRPSIPGTARSPSPSTCRSRAPSRSTCACRRGTGTGVPGGLYRFDEPAHPPVKLTVNGKPVALKVDRGFATVSRTWTRGDVVQHRSADDRRRVTADTAHRRRRGQGRGAARPDRLRARGDRQRRQGARRFARRRAADPRVQARSARRRRSLKGQGSGAADLRPLLRLGQPRRRRDGGVDPRRSQENGP